MKTYISSVGDANDIRTWSGIPYHELQEGRRQKIIDAGLPLNAHGSTWSMRRCAWNMSSLLCGRGLGGYQYSSEFLELLWRPFRTEVKGCQIINCFQLFPPSLVSDNAVTRWYHIDQTLVQLFDGYSVRQTIGRWIAADAIKRERIGYERAAGVIAHSHWAARSIILDYGIDPQKVHVVVPGANLDPDTYERWATARVIHTRSLADASRPLKLVFVGKHPERKGLDRLLRALKLAREEGANCTLRIIGCERGDIVTELQDTPAVEWFGYIDKRYDALRYIESVADCDVGCLLSRAEAGGIGLREYHALGLATIGPDVGGSPDHVIPEAARLISPEANDTRIAEVILNLDRDRNELIRMRAVSWQKREELTWASSISKLSSIVTEQPLL